MKLSTKERALKEKVQLADLQSKATLMQKKVYEELQAESLWIEEEIAKAQARVNISEGENIDSTLENTKNGRHESRLGQGSIDFQQPTISKRSSRKSNTIYKTNKVVLQQIKLKVT